MIITSTETRVRMFPCICDQIIPSSIREETLMERINTGTMTGNPKTAIMIDRLLALKAIAEIMVKAEDKPRQPSKRLDKKSE